MKKYVIKATALAIGALVGGAAVASVDFTTATPTVTVKFANELDYSSATGVAITGGKTVTTKLGFGVSTGQDRYIRVDLGGVKLAAAAAGANVTDTTSAFTNAVVVAGGAVGDTYVIYQVTGAAGGHGAADVITIALPNLNSTNANAVSPTVAYNLYETAVNAVNQTAGTSLYSKSGNLFTFAKGLSWTVTTNTTTAAVANSFKKFIGNQPTGTTAVIAQLGRAQYGVDATVVAADGTTPIALTDLVTAATIKITGDFTMGGTGAAVTLQANADCTGASTAVTLATDKLSASVSPGTTANANTYVCWTLNAAGASAAIPEQTLKVDLNPTAVTGTSTVDPVAVTLGNIDRDGTTLQAPFATIHADYLSRVVLTSTYSQDALVTASTITEDGVTCSATYSNTLKAGKQLIINTKDICGTMNTGSRLAVQVTVAAPRNTIQGAYNVMNYNQVTGATNSLITYIMVAPGTN